MMYRLLFLAFIASVSANTCPDVTPVYNFNFASFGQGIWYEVARYPLYVLKNTPCATAEYTLHGDTSSIVYSFVNNNKKITLNTTIKFDPDANNAARMVYNILQETNRPSSNVEIGTDYIVAIDYDNYAISYTCRYNEDTKTLEEYSWILSRSKYPSEKTKSDIENFVKLSPLLDSKKYIYNVFNEDVCRIDS